MSNKERLRPLAGRPTKYHDEIPQEMLDYFYRALDKQVTEEVATATGVKVINKTTANRFPSFEGFCVSICIARDTLYNWKKKYPLFSDTFEKCRQVQREFLMVHSLEGNYNAGFSKFLLTNISEYKDKVHQEIESTQTIKINIDEEDAEL